MLVMSDAHEKPILLPIGGDICACIKENGIAFRLYPCISKEACLCRLGKLNDAINAYTHELEAFSDGMHSQKPDPERVWKAVGLQSPREEQRKRALWAEFDQADERNRKGLSESLCANMHTRDQGRGL